jgi:hypothetical protein
VGVNDFKTIDDVCTYGTKLEGVCKHEDPVGEGGAVDADRIWNTSSWFAFTRDRKYLVPEAEAAAKASAGYLFVMYQAIEALKTNPSYDVRPALEAWFDRESGSASNRNSLFDRSGYFVCR